jgi:YD repeat-containing protein
MAKTQSVAAGTAHQLKFDESARRVAQHFE